jgi:DUF2934 family protein
MATRRTTPSARSSESPQSAPKAAPSRRAPPTVSSSPASGPSARIAVSDATRRAMIEQAAYLRAERRGFASGGEVEDWLAAEAEVDALLKAGNGGTPQ